jgi:hypothetical protein
MDENSTERPAEAALFAGEGAVRPAGRGASCRAGRHHGRSRPRPAPSRPARTGDRRGVLAAELALLAQGTQQPNDQLFLIEHLAADSGRDGLTLRR